MKKKNIYNITSNGFKTPKDYFTSFDDKLMERLKNEPNFEVTESGFIAPDNYFDSLEDKVFEKLDIKKETSVISIFRSKKLYYISGIAASILLLLAIFVNNPNTTEELSPEMVENYFMDSDLDTYELADLLSDADILKDDFKLIETNYNEDNLEDYLIDNADIEAILE